MKKSFLLWVRGLLHVFPSPLPFPLLTFEQVVPMVSARVSLNYAVRMALTYALATLTQAMAHT